MQKQRMIKMLKFAREAVDEAGLSIQKMKADGEIISALSVTEGTQNLIGQLILASAIEESGSSVSMSLDKLEGLTLELSEVAGAIQCVAANLPNTE